MAFGQQKNPLNNQGIHSAADGNRTRKNQRFYKEKTLPCDTSCDTSKDDAIRQAGPVASGTRLLQINQHSALSPLLKPFPGLPMRSYHQHSVYPSYLNNLTTFPWRRMHLPPLSAIDIEHMDPCSEPGPFIPSLIILAHHEGRCR